MKIVSIVGTRPQFIKLSPLSKELRKKHNEIIVHTGQHYDYNLSKLFFEELEIPKPDYNLEVGSGNHGKQTGLMLIRIEEVLKKENPDLIIVFGDTNSTLAGALAATKLHIKVAHVEAGMRNFDRNKPEEVNRILTDHIADLLFTPTEAAVINLKNEGISRGVFAVGDVTYDAFEKNLKVAESKSNILQKLSLNHKEYIISTIHKQKNTNNKDRLTNIINGLTSIHDKIVFPIHPRTKKFLKTYKIWDTVVNSNIILTEPLGYLDFIKLMKYSKKIITDSGGIQREAYILKVPCITLRETEWVETVRDGWNIIVDTDARAINNAILNFIPQKKQNKIFGRGDACRKISLILNNVLKKI